MHELKNLSSTYFFLNFQKERVIHFPRPDDYFFLTHKQNFMYVFFIYSISNSTALLRYDIVCNAIKS